MDSVGEGDGGERPRDPAGDARPGGSAVGLMESFPAVSGRDPAESVREGDAAELSRIGTVLRLSDSPGGRRREDPDGLRGGRAGRWAPEGCLSPSGVPRTRRSSRPPSQWPFWNEWRRGWDSNPRSPCGDTRFRGEPDRPLWHLSGRWRARILAIDAPPVTR